MENAIAGVIGFGLGLALQITRAPLPKVERPSDDAFRYSPQDVPPARSAGLLEPIVRYAARQWGKL